MSLMYFHVHRLRLAFVHGRVNADRINFIDEYDTGELFGLPV